jgi:hypothetical protein
VYATPAGAFNRPIALKSPVTETGGGASKPVLPTAPERRRRDGTGATGIRRGVATAVRAGHQAGAQSTARRVLSHDAAPSQGADPEPAAGGASDPGPPGTAGAVSAGTAARAPGPAAAAGGSPPDGAQEPDPDPHLGRRGGRDARCAARGSRIAWRGTPSGNAPTLAERPGRRPPTGNRVLRQRPRPSVTPASEASRGRGRA